VRSIPEGMRLAGKRVYADCYTYCSNECIKKLGIDGILR
jgi:hypothetical protein